MLGKVVKHESENQLGIRINFLDVLSLVTVLTTMSSFPIEEYFKYRRFQEVGPTTAPVVLYHARVLGLSETWVGAQPMNQMPS